MKENLVMGVTVAYSHILVRLKTVAKVVLAPSYSEYGFLTWFPSLEVRAFLSTLHSMLAFKQVPFEKHCDRYFSSHL